MNIQRSSFYAWKKKLAHPSKRMKSLLSNILLFKEYHAKFPSHGYRWLNAKIRLDTGLVLSDAYAHKCCKITGIKSQAKHYKYKKPGDSYRVFPNLLMTEIQIDGRDFGHLPGLLQYHVHYELLHKFTRGKSVKDCYYLDAEEEGEETQIADKDNVFERTEVNQLFSAARLSKEQTNAVNELVLNELDHRLFCKKYACSSKTAFKHRANGLKKLKSLLA